MQPKKRIKLEDDNSVTDYATSQCQQDLKHSRSHLSGNEINDNQSEKI